jgi:homoserine kinase
VRARVPASSANLGPGFDSLGLALCRYTEVSVEPAAALEITAEGAGSHLPCDHTHLAAEIVRDVLGHDDVRIHVSSEVPLARGMGSSAALIAATAAAAGHPDPFAYTALREGHADNAAAAVLGGLVTGAIIDATPVARRLPLDEALVFCLVIPDTELSTKAARQALPDAVPRGDAVFNIGRMGLLIAGLAEHSLLLPEATDDRLHQHYRAPLFPSSGPLMTAMRDAGALGACWSGAGPSLIGICTYETVDAVVGAAQAMLRRLDVPGTAELIEADLEGLVLED